MSTRDFLAVFLSNFPKKAGWIFVVTGSEERPLRKTRKCDGPWNINKAAGNF